jgi:hypothetical protein
MLRTEVRAAAGNVAIFVAPEYISAPVLDLVPCGV